MKTFCGDPRWTQQCFLEGSLYNCRSHPLEHDGDALSDSYAH